MYTLFIHRWLILLKAAVSEEKDSSLVSGLQRDVEVAKVDPEFEETGLVAIRGGLEL